MAYSEIIYDVSERVATITLNRPDKLNAWTQVMEKEVQEAMLGANRDDNVRAKGKACAPPRGAISRWDCGS